MAPFGAEKHVFWWSRQKGKSNMDSFWMISGFFGTQKLFLEVPEGFKILNPKFCKKNTGNLSRFSRSTETLILGQISHCFLRLYIE